MRSRLEATFAANMDRWGVDWTYEPRAYGAAGMRQWLPDFELQLTAQHVLVEVKGSLRATEAEGGRKVSRRDLQTRMSVAWETDPTLVLVIAEDEWTVVESNPMPGSVWAGATDGWRAAVFGSCRACNAKAVYALTKRGTLSGPACCGSRDVAVFYPFRRQA